MLKMWNIRRVLIVTRNLNKKRRDVLLFFFLFLNTPQRGWGGMFYA
jgi:hypothetical protein